MCIFKKRKKEQVEQRVLGIIYNAISYELDDNLAAPKRKTTALAVVEETQNAITKWELRPVEPIAHGREASFNDAVNDFKQRFLGGEVPQSLAVIEEKLKARLGSYLVVL